MLVLAEMANETRLVIVLVQLVVIVLAARLAGWLFAKIGQPAVIGEIAAGLALGPSVFGKLETLAGITDHRLSTFIFDPAVGDTISILSQLGLIFLMFLVGLEFELVHLRRSPHAAVGISLAGLILPFGLGLGLAPLIHPYLEGVTLAPDTAPAPVPLFGFSLFMGLAMSITALPVLGRLLMDLHIVRTRIATLTLSAAALNDAIGWILLAAISALAKSQYQFLGTVEMLGLVVGFVLLMAFAVRPLLVRLIGWAMNREHGELGPAAMTVLLVSAFLCALATSKIGIFAIFGPFVLGAVLSDQHAFRHAVSAQLRNFVSVLLLPIFFTYTGIRTDIGSLGSASLWAIAGLILLAAIIGKLIACTLAARLTAFNWRESWCVGAMMNTRGLMELVVINVGYDLHLIPRSVFCMLVLMAVVTTFMTTPLLRLLAGGTELEAAMKRRPAREKIMAH